MSVINDAITFLFPRCCHICGNIGKNIDDIPFEMPGSLSLCEECFEKIIPVDKDKRWLLCLSEPFVGDKYPSLVLYLPFLYDDFFARVIHSIKFGGRKDLAIFMGRILGSIIEDDGILADVIIPIPLSNKRLKERGYNQAELISQGCSDVISLPVMTNILRRTKNTNKQAKITDKAQRSLNVDNAFSLVEENNNQILGKTILLIDDVATTGHTMHEAATVLLDSGAGKVLCVAICGNRSAKNADPY